MTAIYDNIGDGYDNTRRVDPHIKAIFSELLQVKSHRKYLDIACGTGNYTVELSKLGGEWFAFDQAEKMLLQARTKSTMVDWRQCDVEKTDYPNIFFDAAMCSLATHHFPHLVNAVEEISRILKSEGRLVIFTSTPEQMRGYWLNHYFPQMMATSSSQMSSNGVIQQAMARHDLIFQQSIPFFVSPELEDLFLYSGKHRPEVYLSDSVRRGTSSFRTGCSESELHTGLAKLADDIHSGKIADLIASYKNNLGDYLFIGVKKKIDNDFDISRSRRKRSN